MIKVWNQVYVEWLKMLGCLICKIYNIKVVYLYWHICRQEEKDLFCRDTKGWRRTMEIKKHSKQFYPVIQKVRSQCNLKCCIWNTSTQPQFLFPNAPNYTILGFFPFLGAKQIFGVDQYSIKLIKSREKKNPKKAEPVVYCLFLLFLLCLFLWLREKTWPLPCRAVA